MWGRRGGILMKIALAADHGGFDAIAFPLTPPKMREIIEVCIYDLSYNNQRSRS